MYCFLLCLFASFVLFYMLWYKFVLCKITENKNFYNPLIFFNIIKQTILENPKEILTQVWKKPISNHYTPTKVKIGSFSLIYNFISLKVALNFKKIQQLKLYIYTHTHSFWRAFFFFLASKNYFSIELLQF